jgi:hypothetical protein
MRTMEKDKEMSLIDKTFNAENGEHIDAAKEKIKFLQQLLTGITKLDVSQMTYWMRNVR